MPKLTELAVLFFMISNSLRIFAYLPQLIRVIRDREGAVAISYLTWSMFAIANFSTAMYAVLVLQDVSVTIIFIGNFGCCVAIVVATAARRRLRKHAGMLRGKLALSEMVALHRMSD